MVSLSDLRSPAPWTGRPADHPPIRPSDRPTVLSPSRLPLLPRLRDPRLYQPPHECRRRELRMREPDRPLRGLILLEVGGVGLLDRRGDGIQAAVMLPGGVPHQR